MVSKAPGLKEKLKRLGWHMLVFFLPFGFALPMQAFWHPFVSARAKESLSRYMQGGREAFFGADADRWIYFADTALGFSALLVPLALVGGIAAPRRGDRHFLSLLTTAWVGLFGVLLLFPQAKVVDFGMGAGALIASWMICAGAGTMIALALYTWRKARKRAV
ncbi:hypothetical protein SAMN05877809_10250 [Rhodobacter sp. JA431]|uniref:hypothetical protein n=1 Tax=Rhodobacter sp. JA431 TaxID=570013 RepID=UPI000BD9DB91|nr:hypothetical protein [Rhodobacter sp. JA431]SOB97855.1 hypothetical protein SAMN05877809_10250 [Rhodobacter sp. JA431]